MFVHFGSLCQVESMLKISLPFFPAAFLLLEFNSRLLRKHSILLVNSLTAASILIAKYWKLAMVPTKEEWLSEVRYIHIFNK